MNEEQTEAEACLEASRERLNGARAFLREVRSERVVHIKVMQNAHRGMEEAKAAQRLAREKFRESQAALVGIASDPTY